MTLGSPTTQHRQPLGPSEFPAVTDGIDSSVGCSRISTLVVPSEFPETAPYEALREVCRRQIDMQFADLHVALQLPAASIDPDVGLNLTTAALLFSLVAGASVILHEPSWKAFKSGAASGSRFKAALEHAYPWRPDDGCPAQQPPNCCTSGRVIPWCTRLGSAKTVMRCPAPRAVHPTIGSSSSSGRSPQSRFTRCRKGPRDGHLGCQPP